MKSNGARVSASIVLFAACACLNFLAQASVSSSPIASPDRQDAIAVTLIPSQPLIERFRDQQIANFDLLIRNLGPDEYRLVGIKSKVFDRSGKLEVERELNENGTPPALDAIGPRQLPPGGVIDIYQTFYSFNSAINLERMRFDLMFMKEGDRVLLIGSRDVEDLERRLLDHVGVRRIQSKAEATTLASDFSRDTDGWYFHFDLDVLSPKVAVVNQWTPPGGMMLEEVLQVVDSIRARVPVKGFGLGSFDPAVDESGRGLKAATAITELLLPNKREKT